VELIRHACISKTSIRLYRVPFGYRQQRSQACRACITQVSAKGTSMNPRLSSNAERRIPYILYMHICSIFNTSSWSLSRSSSWALSHVHQPSLLPFDIWCDHIGKLAVAEGCRTVGRCWSFCQVILNYGSHPLIPPFSHRICELVHDTDGICVCWNWGSRFEERD
jgi:hypothetical protein